jgi:hypothetical protein
MEWVAASVQDAVELQSALLRSYGLLAQRWLWLTGEVQQAMLDAFGLGLSEPGRGPTTGPGAARGAPGS